MLRNLNPVAGVPVSTIATVTLPAMTEVVQRGVRRNLNFLAAGSDLTVSVVALPVMTEVI